MDPLPGMGRPEIGVHVKTINPIHVGASVSYLVLHVCWLQMWCILAETGEADLMDRTSAAALTVCSYPEVTECAL